MAKPNYRDLTKEQLVALLEARDRKKFGLVWERDAIEHDRALNEDFVALEPVPDLHAGEGPFQNLIIEGDNFDALRALRAAYSGQVKCIYIDPPYNTGNRDFVYNDRFVNKDHAWRHSTWLEFIFQRITLAKDLLSADGVLLVSINDENRARLELLLDEVLSGMRIGSFTWRTKDTGNDSGGNLSQVHEHVLIYGQQGFSFAGNLVDDSKYRNPDKDPLGRWDPRPLTKAHSFKQRPNTYYPIQDPSTGYWYPCDPDRVWAYATAARLKPGQKLRAETIEELIQSKVIYFPPCKTEEVMQWNTIEALIAAIRSGNGPVSPKKKSPLLRENLPDLDFWVGKPIAPGRPSKKAYLKDKKDKPAPISSWIAGINEAIDPIYDEWSEEAEFLRCHRGGEGTTALVAALGAKGLEHPKPPSLIRTLVEQASMPGSIIVDFFAGSGTTAQAVLELNAEKPDEAPRKFILVSSTEATEDDPNKNLCRHVCRQRVANVISGYNDTPGTGGNFAYLRTKRIPLNRIVRRIDHSQVWLHLQLMHFESWDDRAAVASGRLHFRTSGDDAVFYLTDLSSGVLKRVEKELAGLPDATLYTWQPEAVEAHFGAGHATVMPIPQTLIDRFGFRS